MFGNKEGWIISAIIVALMGWLLFSIGRLEPMSRPSGQFTNLRDPVKLPVAPDEALPGVMTQDRDAGEQYWQAVELYKKFPAGYKFNPKEVDNASNLPAVRLLVEARNAKRATLFLDRPKVLVNYGEQSKDLELLGNIGLFANSIGSYYVLRKSDAERAEPLLQAAFSLGAKLFDERVSYEEMFEGLKLMRSAAAAMAEMEKARGNPARADAIRRFDHDAGAYEAAFLKPLEDKVMSVGGADVGRHAGDVFELALHNPDRMWRAEALLKVGRMKFERGASASDQVWAKRLLSEPQRMGIPDLTQDKDPAVKHAATIARDLTSLGQINY
jgi:hypothetical protein